MPSAHGASDASGVPGLISPRLERFQVKYINPLVAPLAGRVPFFAVVHHRGRKTSRPYRTTVRAFTKGSVLAIILVHGKTDWVKNVLAAQTAEVGLSRRSVHIVNPRIVPRGSRDSALPAVARIFLRRTAVFVGDIA